MTDQTAIIIVAAGRGTRAGDGLPKQWRDLAGKPVLAHTLRAFDGLGRILLVVHPDDMARGLDLTLGRATLVAGGGAAACATGRAPRDRRQRRERCLHRAAGAAGVGSALIRDRQRG